MVTYVRGFLALFVLVTVLQHLPPGKEYQKYIRFFAELILTLGLLSPILSVICDKEEFLEMIDYEEFNVEISSIAKDMQRMEYLQGDYYIHEYENAIAQDVIRIAEGQGFCVKEASVALTEEYTVERISLVVSDEETGIAIAPVVLGETAEKDRTDVVCAALRQELLTYYQVDENMLEIQYVGNG